MQNGPGGAARFTSRVLEPPALAGPGPRFGIRRP